MDRDSLVTLCKKHMMKLIIVLMLIWTVYNVFVLPLIAAAGIFCSVVVPTVNVAVGKKACHTISCCRVLVVCVCHNYELAAMVSPF